MGDHTLTPRHSNSFQENELSSFPSQVLSILQHPYTLYLSCGAMVVLLTAYLVRLCIQHVIPAVQLAFIRTKTTLRAYVDKIQLFFYRLHMQIVSFCTRVRNTINQTKRSCNAAVTWVTDSYINAKVTVRGAVDNTSDTWHTTRRGITATVTVTVELCCALCRGAIDTARISARHTADGVPRVLSWCLILVVALLEPSIRVVVGGFWLDYLLFTLIPFLGTFFASLHGRVNRAVRFLQYWVVVYFIIFTYNLICCVYDVSNLEVVKAQVLSRKATFLLWLALPTTNGRAILFYPLAQVISKARHRWGPQGGQVFQVFKDLMFVITSSLKIISQYLPHVASAFGKVGPVGNFLFMLVGYLVQGGFLAVVCAFLLLFCPSGLVYILYQFVSYGLPIVTCVNVALHFGTMVDQKDEETDISKLEQEEELAREDILITKLEAQHNVFLDQSQALQASEEHKQYNKLFQPPCFQGYWLLPNNLWRVVLGADEVCCRHKLCKQEVEERYLLQIDIKQTPQVLAETTKSISTLEDWLYYWMIHSLLIILAESYMCWVWAFYDICLVASIFLQLPVHVNKAVPQPVNSFEEENEKHSNSTKNEAMCAFEPHTSIGAHLVLEMLAATLALCVALLCGGSMKVPSSPTRLSPLSNFRSSPTTPLFGSRSRPTSPVSPPSPLIKNIDLKSLPAEHDEQQGSDEHTSSVQSAATVGVIVTTNNNKENSTPDTFNNNNVLPASDSTTVISAPKCDDSQEKTEETKHNNGGLPSSDGSTERRNEKEDDSVASEVTNGFPPSDSATVVSVPRTNEQESEDNTNFPSSGSTTVVSGDTENTMEQEQSEEAKHNNNSRLPSSDCSTLISTERTAYTTTVSAFHTEEQENSNTTAVVPSSDGATLISASTDKAKEAEESVPTKDAEQLSAEAPVHKLESPAAATVKTVTSVPITTTSKDGTEHVEITEVSPEGGGDESGLPQQDEPLQKHSETENKVTDESPGAHMSEEKVEEGINANAVVETIKHNESINKACTTTTEADKSEQKEMKIQQKPTCSEGENNNSSTSTEPRSSPAFDLTPSCDQSSPTSTIPAEDVDIAELEKIKSVSPSLSQASSTSASPNNRGASPASHVSQSSNKSSGAGSNASRSSGASGSQKRPKKVPAKFNLPKVPKAKPKPSRRGKV